MPVSRQWSIAARRPCRRGRGCPAAARRRRRRRASGRKGRRSPSSACARRRKRERRVDLAMGQVGGVAVAEDEHAHGGDASARRGRLPSPRAAAGARQGHAVVPHDRGRARAVTEGWFDLRPRRPLRPARAHGRHARARHRHLGRLLGVRDGAPRRGRRRARRRRRERVDWPPRRRPKEFPDRQRGDGFRLVKEIKGSTSSACTATSTTRRPRSSGTFDLVFCGAVLIHLRDQLLALERIAQPLPRPVHLRRRVRPAREPHPVPGLALPRRPRRGRRLLAARRSRRGSG